MGFIRFALAIAAGTLLAHPSASAGEIRVLSTIAVKSVLEDLLPRFERESGNTVTIQYGTTAVLRKQIEAGERFDVAIFTPPDLIDEMVRQGTVEADSRSDFASTSVGVAVRRGTPKPDVSSLDAFQAALLSARSIGYTDPARGGTSGVHLKAVIDRFGIADRLEAKTKLSPGIPALMESIANGEVGLGMLQISEIVADPRLDLVGPLPKGAEKATVITMGLRRDSREAAAGRALIRFLASPDAALTIKARGLEPASSMRQGR